MNLMHALPARLWRGLVNAVISLGTRDEPDQVIGAGAAGGPYLLRWHLIPRNPVMNVYLHCFLRDDDDRALHDHPWPWCSLLLFGSYVEHTIAAGGIHRRRVCAEGSLRLSTPWRAHRIELLPRERIHPDHDPGRRPAWTLFITGPRIRAWGFHCPEQGWVHYRLFTDPEDPGRVGAGCEGGR